MNPVQNLYLSVSLYVGNLHEFCTEANLFEHFTKEQFTVVSVRICRDVKTKKSLHYGYVNYQTHEEADRALDQMNHSDIITSGGSQACRVMWSDRDSTLRKSNVGNTFVKNFSKDMTVKDLEDAFSYFGNIKSCKLLKDQNGNSRGQAYVHFDDPAHAENATKAAEAGTINGIPGVIVEPYKKKEQRASAQILTLYCKHFPEKWTSDDVNQRFLDLGLTQAEIKGIWVPTKLILKENLGTTVEVEVATGYCTANFSDRNAAVKALTLNLQNPICYGSMSKNGDLIPFLAVEHKRKSDREREKKIRVENGKADTKRRKVYVINLESGVTEGQFIDYFNKFRVNVSGDEDVKIVRYVLKPNNQAYILYSNLESADFAIREHEAKELKIKDTDSKPLVVKPFLSVDERSQKKQVYIKNNYQQRVPQYRAGGGFPAFAPRYGNYGYSMPSYQNQPFHQPSYNHNSRAMRMPGMSSGMRSAPPNTNYNRLPQHMRYPSHRQNQQVYNNRGNNYPNQGQNRQMPGPPQIPAIMPQAPSQQPRGFNVDQLHNLPHDEQVNIIGEELYSKIYSKDPVRAGKITGMLLEMDVTELLHLIESPDLLQEKMEEAVKVLEEVNKTNN